jgi:endonuclease YncB( thermonuclease family)
MHCLLLPILLFFTLPAVAESLSGQATIIDGDTVRVGETTIHLYGIDAPEMNQFCRDKKDKRFNCGHAAMRRLFLYIGADPLDCTIKAHNEDGSLAATCQVKSYFRQTENGASRGEKFDVSLEMVLTGYAFSTRAQASDYTGAEERARTKGMGFWSGRIEPPWEWRTQPKDAKK